MSVLGDTAGGSVLGTAISPGLGTLLGGAVGALGSLGSSLLGLKNQSNTNKAQMKLAEYQYQKNLEMWNLNNEFNSPLQQLNRLREAGLNPNLVYGGNSVGNYSGNVPTYEAPKLSAYTDFSGVGNAATTALNVALAYRDLGMKDEQKRLLSAQADAMQQESLKKMQETANEFWKTARTKFDLDLASDLRQTSMEAAQEGVNKIKQEIAESQHKVFKINAEIDKLYYDSLISKEQVEYVKAATANLMQDLDIKKFNRKMLNIGISPNSGVTDRILLGIFGSLIGEKNLKGLLDDETHDYSK